LIDPATNKIYAVSTTWAPTKDPGDLSTEKHQLIAYDLTTGAPVAGFPRTVDPPGADPRMQQQRASLALDGSEILVPFGGVAGDCGKYWGWLVALKDHGAGAFSFYRVSGPIPSNPDSYGSGIWAGGNAPVIDAAGNIFVSTGNSDDPNDSQIYNFSNSILKFDANLNLLDWWAPKDWWPLDHRDADIGAGAPLLLPNGLIFAIGKPGIAYLLRAGSLGRGPGDPPNQLQVCPYDPARPTDPSNLEVSQSFAGAIYNPSNSTVYLACHTGLAAVKVDLTTLSMSLAWTPTSVPRPKEHPAPGPPILAGGSIWYADPDTGHLQRVNPKATSPGAGVTFDAYLTDFMHFVTPGAGGGRLFIPNDTTAAQSQGRSFITAFTIDAHTWSSRTVTRLASSANPSAPGAAVRFTANVRPVPNGGKMRFTDRGKPIARCAAVPVSPLTGHAICRTRFRNTGSHLISAVYSGDRSARGSRSRSLTQRVR
jgi:hypothetical protein